jgi:hypothetical protein
MVMKNTMQTNFHGMGWMAASGTVLIGLSIGLNVLIAQTLGSWSVAAVILALYVACLAYVIGGIALAVVSISLFVKRKLSLSEWSRMRPGSRYQEYAAPTARFAS